ncbi:MAG TPA: YihY/virulence factor BrkB family protein [Acidimicrobiia bacterium]
MDRSIGERARTVFDVLKHALKEYGRDLASRMAAAISYRTVFALTPMLVVAVSIATLVLGGNEEAQAAISRAITDLAGADVAMIVDELLESALDAADTAALIGFLVLLWSSSTLFIELQRALNDIFEIPIPDEKRLFVLAIQRSVGVLWTVGIGIMLVVVFALNAAVQIAGEAISSRLGTNLSFISIFSVVLSIGLMALIFALVFQTLTIHKIPWRAAWVGGGFTAAGFTIAGLGTGIYFRQFDQPTALGISSSIVVLIFLAYLLSSVFLFGAEVSRSYWLSGDRDQSQLLFKPENEAEVVPGHAPVAISMTALATFLIGLIVGRKGRD